MEGRGGRRPGWKAHYVTSACISSFLQDAQPLSAVSWARDWQTSLHKAPLSSEVGALAEAQREKPVGGEFCLLCSFLLLAISCTPLCTNYRSAISLDRKPFLFITLSASLRTLPWPSFATPLQISPPLNTHQFIHLDVLYMPHLEF